MDRAPTRFDANGLEALDHSMLASFTRDGVLVLEGLVTAAACARLIRRATELTAAIATPDDPTVFSTLTHAHADDDYFLGSGDEVRFFFEEGAVGDDGRLRREPARAVNKIGHALHDLDPEFAAFSRLPALRAVVRGLGVADPRLIQSMYIFKQPGIGGEVVWHQDATFLRTDPPSVLGLWIALEDATLDNGCLWALPGAHRETARRTFRRGEGGLQMDTLDPTPWPTDEGVPLEVPRGTLVVLHGMLPHWSGPNHSPRSRHAYAVHVIDGRAHYASDNWLLRRASRPARGFDGLPAP